MAEGRIIELNNDPEDVLEFVEQLGESLDKVLEGKKERDWALGVVADLHAMVEVVIDAINRSKSRQGVQISIPFPTKGPKS